MAQEDVLRNSYHIAKNMVSYSPQVIFMMDWELCMTMVKWVLNSKII